MFPFLLPVCLLLYGEFSKGKNTRYISRTLFYAYTLSTLLPMYVENSSYGVILAVLILIGGIGNCIAVMESHIGRASLLIALVSSTLNYSSLLLQDFTLLMSIPYYADYSHFVFRESLLIAVTMSSIEERLEHKDFKLELYLTLLWVYEHAVMKGVF